VNSNWALFLRERGATIEAGRTAHFGDPDAELRAARDGAVLCDLSAFGLIRFSGSDARAFLQGQLTNDVEKLTRGSSQYGAHCTPKGRVVATFLLWQWGDDYFSQLPATLVEAVQNRMKKYVLRSKVELSEPDYVCIGVAGAQASGRVRALFGAAPEPHRNIYTGDVILFGLPHSRFEIIAPVALAQELSRAQEIWQALAQDAQPAGGHCWDWIEIRAGIPWITAATQDQFVPQMLNLDLIGGVSFNKGCYPGQEIVARLHYLGSAKRRMYLANVASPMQAADPLFSAHEPAGTIVNAACSPEGGYDVLAVIQIASVEAGPVQTQSGARLRLLPLP
jgi:folate-binding protein YgfZ